MAHEWKTGDHFVRWDELRILTCIELARHRVWYIPYPDGREDWMDSDCLLDGGTEYITSDQVFQRLLEE